MRVLLYSPLAVLGHHFETDLEIAQNHLAEGDEVTIVTCSGQLKTLNFMACQGLMRCQLCVSRCKQGIGTLTQTEKLNVVDLGDIQPIECTAGHDLSTVEGIKGVHFEGIDVGSAYASSAISDSRDPRPDMSGRVSQTKRRVDFLAGLKRRFDALLDTVRPETVYFFNGRFCLYRPLLRLCQNRKIDFFVHERGANNGLYSLMKNNLPHDIEAVNQSIRTKWADSERPVEEKRAMASAWYEKRAAGQSLAWRSFTDTQDLARLPNKWKNEQTNIAFFVSSEDEFAAIPGWEYTYFQTQAEAIAHVCKYFASDARYAFYVRIHPNLRGLRNKTMQDLKNLEKQFSNCEVIVPDSEISTYTLIKRANKVVSFGSTVGVEATYWQRPSILATNSFFRPLGVCHTPDSLDEMVAMIADPSLSPKPQDTALMYGYWTSTLGFPFRYYKALNLTTGAFRGTVITGLKPLLWLNYAFVTLKDLKKVLKGEYSLWHLGEKIRYKLKLFGRVG